MTERLRTAAAARRPARARPRGHRAVARPDRSSSAAWTRPPHGPAWTFYEGPPTANGMPGTHHVEARVFKDVFPRWRTMKGYHVPRMAGWDCHGLPVELAVEKELGFTGKPDIEAYGIAEFNAQCRENVQRHVDAFEAMSERMGYWADYEHAYWTMTPDYVESVWWALKTIFDKGLLVEDFRVAPYCTALRHRAVRPRAGAGLRDRRRPVGVRAAPADLRARTPARPRCWCGRRRRGRCPATRWSRRNADVTYATVTDGDRDRSSWPATSCGKALGDGWSVLDTLHRRRHGAAGPTSARSTSCRGPGRATSSCNEDYVTTDDGTGLVHQATVFGADDFDVGTPQRRRTRQPDRRPRPLRGRPPAGRRHVLQGRRRGASSPISRLAAGCSGTCRTSTATRTAGAATPR